MEGEMLPFVYINKRSRQRIASASPATEISPMAVASSTGESSRSTDQQTHSRTSYSTFRKPSESAPLQVVSKPPPPHLKSAWSHFFCPTRSSASSTSPLKNAADNHNYCVMVMWKVVLVFSAVIAVLACLRKNPNDYALPALPEWHWDHNVYIPRAENDAQFARNHRISLIAQVVTNRALNRLANVSSRPNRAYARQWGVDYTRYDAGRTAYNSKSCFDKIFVLNTILNKQTEKETDDPPPLWAHAPRVRYDYILLLPPDSIVTDLDKNLFDIVLPEDKLVAIAGWSDGKRSNSNSDVILFNLNHRHADAVAKLWWEMTLPKQVTCGANNELGMLITAIASVVEEKEGLDGLLEPLEETEDGFVGDHLIKYIAPSVPGSRSLVLIHHIQESGATLEETSDSVCYRFYPKCEVL